MTVDRINLADLSAVLPGTYTVATLPLPSLNVAKYAFVTDLGGGPDMCISDGTNWKHIRKGTPGYISATTTIPITPLVTNPQVILTGSNITSAVAFRVQPANLYQGYECTVTIPSGVFGALGTLGVGLGTGGINVVPVIGGYWYDFSYDGTQMVKIRGGSL